ncbi:MAG: DUF5723 family protein [Saprospiraceae bacterium]
MWNTVYARARALLISWVLTTNILLLGMLPLAAQRNLTLHHLNAVPQSSLLNPARMPLSNVYVGIPLLGNLNAGYTNNGLTFGDLGISGDEEEGFLYNDFSELRNLLGENNKLLTDFSVGWIDFGFRVQQNFFSFQVSDFLQFEASYPRALFDLIDDAQNEDGEEQNTNSYVLDALGLNGTHFRSYSLGYTRQINPYLSAGARLKYLSGLANVTTINQGLRVDNDSDSEFFNIQGRLDVLSSGLQTLEQDPGAYLSGTGNRGFAFDLGVNYQVNDQIEVFGSVINVGSIRWKNDITSNAFVADSIELSDDNIDEFEETIGDFIDSLQAPGQTGFFTYKTRLPIMAYFGGNYYFRPNTSIGLLVNPRFYNRQTNMAFSVAFQHRVNRWLQAVVNYSNYDRTGSSVGAGLALNLGPLQLYMASDNFLPLFNIADARSVQFNAGLNLGFGRVTRDQRSAMWKGEDVDNEELSVESIANADIESEKPKVQKTEKAKPPKEEKPAKATKPARVEAEPSTPTPTPVAEERKPYVTLLGSANAINSGDTLRGLAVDVYRTMPDGNEETVLFKSFLNGQIQLSLQRSETYRIVVKKPGYTEQSIRVTPVEMEDANTLTKQVTLAVAPPIEKPKPPVRVETNPAPQVSVQANPVVIKKPDETYSLPEATSFREGPSHETRTILRFPAGAKVLVIEKTNDLWWRVRYLGRPGYVKAALLEPVE